MLFVKECSEFPQKAVFKLNLSLKSPGVFHKIANVYREKSNDFLLKNRTNEAQVTSKHVDFYEHSELHLSVVVTFMLFNKQQHGKLFLKI